MAVSGRKQSDLSESVLKSSAEDFDHKCVPCLSSDNKIVEATGFCVTCQELLCKECFKFHKKTNALKHHELLDQVSMPRGGTSSMRDHTKSIPEIFTQRCSTHKNEYIKFFCPMHETVGCTVCITIDHRTCKIDYIPENCTGIAESVEYSNVILKLDKKIKETDAVLIKAGHRDKFLDLQYDNFITEVAKHRKRIDNRLDELQTKVIEIAGKRRSQDKKIFEEVIGKCSDTSSEAKKMQSNLQDNKASKQNIQLYIDIKQAESKLKTDYIHLTEQSLDKINVQYKFQHNDDLEKMIGELNAFGKISFPSNRSRKEIYSNCLTYVDKINIRTDSDKAFFKCNIIGCAVLRSNKVVLIDSTNNQKLKVVDTDSKTVIEEKVMDAPPAGITALPNDQIAVTIPKKKEILIMSVSNEISLVRRFKLKEECHVITYCQGHLYALGKNPNCILKVDMQGKVLNKLAENCEVSFEAKCMKTGKNMLYYFTCIRNISGTIFRMNLNGEVSAKYKVPFSNDVKDMVVLDDGSLLVCDNSSPDFYRISGDLKEFYAVETDSTDTFSIGYNRGLKKIYTGSYSSNLLKVYDLKL